MAKKSMLARRNKRVMIEIRYAKKRANLKDVIKKSDDIEVRDEAILALQKLPRNASICRQKRRCRVCGRPRSIYRKFGLCRICLRQSLMRGDVPGGTMASW